MKIALVNTYDMKDVKVWAGIPVYISVMLEKLFRDNVHHIQLPLRRNLYSYLKGFYFNRIKKEKYLEWADEAVIKSNKKSFERIAKEEYDIIITFQFFLVPILKGEKTKIIWWSDATFDNLLNNYSYVTNVSAFCSKGGHNLQRRAINISDAIILASDWATNSAINDYLANEKKISKIFFSSHLSVLPSIKEVDEIVRQKDREVIKLLFIGIDWERKGGDDAVAVLNNLNRKGKKAKIYVVGSEVPAMHKNNKNLVSIGFIDKSTPAGENKIINLLKEASFLILPSRAECFGIVLSEANSYALPVITSNVGGIPSVVKNGVNGVSLDLTHFVNDASAFVLENLPGSQSYAQLCYNSFLFYKQEMSLDRMEERFVKVLQDLYPQQTVLDGEIV
jgi:glycosyltransferase involved in cell wall biosynthesis